VLLGNGDGTFQAATSYAAGDRPASVAVGDFNGDGTLDLAVANYVSSGTVSVLLGNGDGSFQAPTSYSTGAYSGSVAVADFNGDGTPDLAVTNFTFGLGTVSVLLGQGDGSFQAATNYATGYGPFGLAVGDLNGDGTPDLVVTNFDGYSVSVLLGQGDGSFQAAISYPVYSSPRSVAVADLNGDGAPDLAVANHDSDTVSILINAADWDGSSPAIPSNPQPASSAAPSPLFVTSRSARPLPAPPPIPAEPSTGQSSPPTARPVSLALALGPPARDAMAAAWDDPLADREAWDWRR
jgi:hypothetical protein